MRKYILIGLLVLVLFLFGCVIVRPPSENLTGNETSPPTQLLGCGAIKDADEGDRCYYEDAIQNNSLVKCSFILSNQLRDKCIYKFAIDRNDSVLCDRILGKFTQDECYFNVAPSVGLSTCNKIANESFKEQCYLKLGNYSLLCSGLSDYNYSLCVAIGSNKPRECDKIGNSTLVDQCYFDFAKNKTSYSACGIVKSIEIRDSCYGFVAYKTKNQSLCDQISFNYSKQLCFARVLGTEAYCDNLSDYLQRDSCIKVFAVERLNEVKCDIIKTNLYRDMCISEIALAKGDPTICSMITCYECITDRDNCYKAVAESAKLISACDQISELLNRDLCRLETARLSVNASQCSTIENNYRRDNCYSMIINSYSYNPSTCDGVVPQIWRDECYNRAALASGNSTICEKIQDMFVKDRCVRGTT